jgi:hypothetical protein
MVLNWHGFKEVSHSGSTAGYSAWLGRYPDRGVSVAVMCNLPVNATQLGHAVADVYLPAASVEAPAPVKGDASRAGLYRSLRDHSTMTVLHDNGELRMGNRPPQVEFDGVRMRFVSPTEIETWEKVEAWRPARAELEALVGEYVSDEADASFTVALDGDRVMLRQRPASRFPMTPTYRDAFTAPIGNVRFVRDASGKVTEMGLSQSRVWDLRFRKVR